MEDVNGCSEKNCLIRRYGQAFVRWKNHAQATQDVDPKNACNSTRRWLVSESCSILLALLA